MTFIPPIPSLVSEANSTTTPLASGVTFTGTGVEALLYTNISVSVFADRQGTLFIEQSTDNTNWDFTKSFIVAISTAECHSSDVCAQFVRVQFENTSANAQATLRLQTLLNPQGVSPETVTSTKIGFDSVAKDAFGRLRVSAPDTLLDTKFVDTKLVSEYSEIVTGSGVVNYTPGFPQVELEVDGDAVGRVVRQTRRYVTYQPGKSLLFFISGTFSEDNTVEGVTSRIGIFDQKDDKTEDTQPTGDGFFFSYAMGVSPALTLVYRTSNNPTFTQIDTVIAQSAWNRDTFDGQGPSGFTIDPTKRNVMWMAQEWLGSGAVQLGFVLDADLVMAHQFDFANNLGIEDTHAYTSRPSLPIRYEIISAGTGAPASVTHLSQICATGMVEGDFNPKGRVFSADRGRTLFAASNTEDPIISLRLRVSQVRHILNPLNMSIVNEDSNQTVGIRIYRFISPAVSPLTDPVWVNSGTDAGLFESAAEYDVSATAVSFAIVPHEHIWSVYVRPNNDINLSQIVNRFLVDADIAGNTDIVVVTAQTVTGAASANIICSLTWQEYS